MSLIPALVVITVLVQIKALGSLCRGMFSLLRFDVPSVQAA
ncbi:MAG: hypothetical protein AB8E74_04445 [Prochlorococcus sp.]